MHWLPDLVKGEGLDVFFGHLLPSNLTIECNQDWQIWTSWSCVQGNIDYPVFLNISGTYKKRFIFHNYLIEVQLFMSLSKFSWLLS